MNGPTMTLRPFSAVLLCTLFTAGAFAQDAKPAADPLAELAWLRGCWQGKVNRATTSSSDRAGDRPDAGPRPSVLNGKTASFEYMRIEVQPDGKLAYILQSSGQKDTVFVYTGMTKEQDVDLHTFANPALPFPARIVYRHTPGNMMFAQLEGKVDGTDRMVVYPFRPVDCISGKTLERFVAR